MRPRHFGLFAAGTLMIASCAGLGAPPQVAVDNAATSVHSMPPSAEASPQVVTDSPAPSVHSVRPSADASSAACPYNDSPCRGPLAAGTYRTDPAGGFWFPLTYTVPDGWVNTEDYPNAFDLAIASTRPTADGTAAA